MKKGKLVHGRNMVNTSTLSSGVYFFRYTNGSQLQSEKFVKQ
jgi:hypothetical protein